MVFNRAERVLQSHGMARKPRIEVDGGLYHLITRGNARQDIFHSPEDHIKYLALLEKQKARFSFFSRSSHGILILRVLNNGFWSMITDWGAQLNIQEQYHVEIR